MSGRILLPALRSLAESALPILKALACAALMLLLLYSLVFLPTLLTL